MPKLKDQQNAPGDEDHTHLGKPLGRYPIRNWRRNRWLLMFLGLATILISIGLTTSLVIDTLARINNHGRAVILNVVPLPAALFVLLFFTGLMLLIIVLIHWQDNITLYKTEMVKRFARKDTTWPFTDTKRFDTYITQINFGGSPVNTRVKIVLESASNQKWTLRNRHDNMVKLIENLRALILPDLIDHFRQDLENDETLVIHRSLQANKGGLRVKSATFPYKSLEYALDNKVLKLYEKDNAKNIVFKSKVHKMMNLDLLIDLLENPLVIEG